MKLYHVTLTKNLPSIMKKGLEPRIGPLSTIAGEEYPTIYTFNNLADLENALMSWMGDYMPDEPLSLLEIKIDINDPHVAHKTDQLTPEYLIFRTVSPNNIKIISKDIDNDFHIFEAKLEKIKMLSGI